MSSIERRIAALEQSSTTDNYINVFIRNFANEGPTTRAAYGGLTFEKRADETVDEFQSRIGWETKNIPRDNRVCVFNFWMGQDVTCYSEDFRR